MASPPQDPVLLRKRLRNELRSLRKHQGLTQAQVADALYWSQSKILRIESGEVRVAPSDARVLAMHYGVTDKRRVEELEQMALMARDEPYAAFKDVHQPASISLFNYEAASIRIRDFSNSLMPGLLQTETYALQLLEHTFGYERKEREHRWEARARRQTLFDRSNFPESFFLLDEGVVRRVVGDRSIMRRQLQHLVDLGKNKRIVIRVVPFGAGAHPGMQGSFTHLEFDDPQDVDVLYLEHVDGEKTVRDDDEATSKYLERFFELEDLALSEDESRALLTRIIAELSDGATESDTKVADKKVEAKT